MKKNFLISALACCFVINSFATTHMVQVANFSFTPSTISGVHPGDTIMWMWVSGTHTTTSQTIPAGAPTWNSAINSTSTVFNYVVPNILGTYNYNCTIHPSVMTGSFTVVGSTNVPAVTAEPGIKVFPNPTAGQLSLEFGQSNAPAQVTVADVAGRIVYNNTYNGTAQADVNLGAAPNGLYIVTVLQNNVARKQELIVSH